MNLAFQKPLYSVVLFSLLSPSLSAQTKVKDEGVKTTSKDWAQRDFWQKANGDPVSDGWQFKDNTVSLVEPRKGGNIFTPPLPSNFELTFQWKIEKGVNNGLKYRVRRFGKHMFGNNFLGVEYQIIDSKPHSDSKSSTAAIYDLVQPTKEKTLHPPGQWNTSKIVAIGDRIEHHLNGKLVASAYTSGPAWETKIALSKFYGSKDFGRPQEGDRIMLTDHGGKVTYRDFRFVEKQAPKVVATNRTGPFLGNATRNSWADSNSIVIWTRTTKNPEMKVDGKKFIKIDRKKHNELRKIKDEAELLGAQLPENAKLEEMFGACPGAAGRVRLSYFPGRQKNAIQRTDWKTTTGESDYTAQWKLQGLKPATTYTTIVEAQTSEGTPSAVIRGAFQTAPKKVDTKPIKFCITTCHDFIRRDDGMNGHKIYPAMKKIKPDFVVHAGDIEYYDKPDPWALTQSLMRFKWGRIFSLPNNRDFYNRTTSYFIKDDHDTLANDSWPGQTYGAVTFEEGVRLFNKEQFPSHPTRYQNIRWGRDLEIWILEGRDYRSPNNMADGPAKTILGEKQKAWLFSTLESSEAKYKLICSPTPIVGPDRKNKKDNHANDIFAFEGKQLRERLAKVPGVIVFCGDRHWQYASVDATSGLWEFGCGPGSEKHQLGWKPGDERPVHQFLRVKGGFLSGELTYQGKSKESKLIIRHRTVTGKGVSEFSFPPAKEEPHDDVSDDLSDDEESNKSPTDGRGKSNSPKKEIDPR